jgi:hypothetical protein
VFSRAYCLEILDNARVMLEVMCVALSWQLLASRSLEDYLTRHRMQPRYARLSLSHLTVIQQCDGHSYLPYTAARTAADQFVNQ